MEKGNRLEIWTIYDRPDDYPSKFVVRKFDIVGQMIMPTEEINLADTVDEARELVPEGLCLIPRSPEDHINVVESWV